MDEFEFGEWLLNEMEKQGLNNTQLAEKSGVHKVTIGFYLTFKRMPTLRTLNEILKALGKKIVFVDE